MRGAKSVQLFFLWGLVILTVLIVAFAMVRHGRGDRADMPAKNVEYVAYENPELGISFRYPKSYGTVIVDVHPEFSGARPPYNVKRYSNAEHFNVTNLRYFDAGFSKYPDLHFGGGFVCWGCDGGRYVGDLDFSAPEGTYEAFTTDTGTEGLLYRAKAAGVKECPEQMCIENVRDMRVGELFVSFKTTSDYQGVTFYAKETPENMTVLRSVSVK